MKTNFLKTWLTMLMLLFGMGVTWGATYKLQKVTEVAAGEKYVFVQDTHAFGSTVSSSALQTVSSYNTTGLAGTEAYVWTLETATGGFYIKNVSLTTNAYLNNASKTNISLGSASSVWAFDFTNTDAVLIQNKSNSDRFLGYTTATSYVYKAYATSNLSDYPHNIKVYKLVEETTSTKTLQSIAVSGTPTKTTYTEGDKFEPAGLVVTGTYSEGDPQTITEGINWSVTPETLTAGLTSVSVTAKVGEITSPAFTVNGLTVNEVTKYTVTWNVNGNTSTGQYAEGANITFPENPEDISGLKFRGWVSSPIEGTSTTEPTYTTSATMGNNDITYYAVFAKKTNGQDTDASVTISNYATANSWQGNGAVAYKSVTIDNNITATTTGTGNNGKYYSDWRMYQNGNGNVILTAADGYTLKSAKFTFTVANTGALFYNSNAVTSETAVELSGTSATFTVGNSGSATNGQVKITKIDVTYSSKPSYSDFRTTVIERTLNGITLSGTYPTEFWKGEEFNHDGMTVTANWSDGDEDVTSEASFSSPIMSTVGEQTVTVTYSTQSTTYTINVKTIANTAETAYTVAQAKALINAGKDLATEVYVKGTVSEIVTAWSNQYNNITYNISADGTTTGDQFQLFRCKTNGAVAGDEVIAYGKLYKHTDGTYELKEGNTIENIVKQFTEIENDIQFVAHNTAGYWATYSNDKDVFIAAADVYTVSVDNETIAMNTVDKEEVPALNNVSGTFVPANTGVLLFVETPVGHNPAEPVTVNVWTVANKTIGALDSNNMLYPSSKSMEEVNAAYYFKLAYDNYETQSGLGFYWGAQNGGAFTCKAGAAYLAVPSGVNARSFYLFDESETTAIDNVNANLNANGAAFNLAGQRVATSQKGIMIINGKKVIK